MLGVTFVSALPVLADAVTTLAAAVFFAIALHLRRLRRRVLEGPLPSFLAVAPQTPLSIVTDVLATGFVAGAVLIARESLVAGVAMLLWTTALFLVLGGLRGQLLLAGLAGLTGGHERARNALAFFDALRHTWRVRRLAPAILTGMVVCGADLAAVYLIFGVVLPAGVNAALAVTCAIRIGTALLMLPHATLTSEDASVMGEEQPVAWHEDLAA
ncbi:MAG: hypothetical protein AB7P33_19535 [Dehalococcoidia bacterium]